MKGRLHSFVDVITNSSTTIYVFQERALEAVKDVINEMLRVFGEEKGASDLFYFGCFNSLESYQEYYEFYEDSDGIDDYEVTALFFDILSGARDKPAWMIKAEQNEKSDRLLKIIPKYPEHKRLATKLMNFLNSSDYEEGEE